MFGINLSLGEGIRKHLPALTIAFVAGMLALVTLGLNAAPASATQDEKVRICHRTAAVVNPYNSIKVSQSAIDGEGNNDHTLHTGPAFDPSLHMQGDSWGDIIPNAANGGVGDGLNWVEGEATWNNDCIPTTAGEQPNIVFEVVCTEVREETIVQVTFTNFGDVSGSAFLNEEEIVVGSGQTVIEYVELDTAIVVEIDEKTVYDATPECEEPEDDGEVLGEDEQVVEPAGAVSAGGGGGSTVNTVVTSLALAGSLAVAGFGARKLKELN